MHLKDPADVAYTVPLELELTGPLAPAALAAALQAVVDRHPALRTAVDAAGDEPRQRILPPGLPVPWSAPISARWPGGPASWPTGICGRSSWPGRST